MTWGVNKELARSFNVRYVGIMTRRDTYIGVLVTKDDKDRAGELAAKENRTLSQWVAMLIVEAIARAGGRNAE